MINKNIGLKKRILRIKEHIFFCLLTPVFCLLFSSANAGFRFSPNCQEAMQAILDLRFEDARFLMDEERKTDPGNGYLIYLEHYAESIELLITEDTRIYEKLIDSYESRMDQMDMQDDGSPQNEWLQAEMLFHTGLAQIKFGTRVSGASKVISSYKRTRDHRKDYPEFWQDQKLTGVYNIIFDHIPPFMRWAADMFGLSGNSELGIYQLNQYCEKAKGTPGLAEEAVLITNLGYKLTGQEEEGFKFLQSQDEEMLGLNLVKYLYANSAIYTYQNDLALKLLSEIGQKDLQITFYGLYYVTGRCKLNHLDPDANIYLEKYLLEYAGSDYKKDICNRLSYYYLLQGNTSKYQEYRAKVAQVGQDLRDRDQEAILESQSALMPHVGLLKARLLCDGGYFVKADSILGSIDQSRLAEKSYQLEYHYRMGRIRQLSGNADEAILELTKCYNEGKDYRYTYATRAAFNLGKIYEEKQDYPNAFLWYERCVDVFSSTHTTEGVKNAAEKGEKRAKGKF